jgi:hypothetical protein
MTAKLASDDGKACYGKRKETIEPVFGQKDGVVRGGSYAVGWPRARRSGSCCAAARPAFQQHAGTFQGVA